MAASGQFRRTGNAGLTFALRRVPPENTRSFMVKWVVAPEGRRLGTCRQRGPLTPFHEGTMDAFTGASVGPWPDVLRRARPTARGPGRLYHSAFFLGS